MLNRHGIDRQEWERRFAARITERAVDEDGKKPNTDELAEIIAVELESWPSTGDYDWLIVSPEDAADEQMSNWVDQGA